VDLGAENADTGITSAEVVKVSAALPPWMEASQRAHYQPDNVWIEMEGTLMVTRQLRNASAIILTLTCLVTGLLPRSTALPGAINPAAPIAQAAVSHGQSATRSAHRTMIPAQFRRDMASWSRQHAHDTALLDHPHEVTNLRTRYSDTYVGRDGVYTVHQGFSPINYQDASGLWRTIDNTLVAASSAHKGAGFAYENAANDYSVAFAASGGGTAFERIEHHGATLDIIPVSAQLPLLPVTATATPGFTIAATSTPGAAVSTPTSTIPLTMSATPVTATATATTALPATTTTTLPTTTTTTATTGTATATPVSATAITATSAPTPTALSAVTSLRLAALSPGQERCALDAGNSARNSLNPLRLSAWQGRLVISHHIDSHVPRSSGRTVHVHVAKRLTRAARASIVDVLGATATVSGSEVAYPRLFPGIDVRYSAESNAVKETLLLRDASSPSSFTFSLLATGAHLDNSAAPGTMPTFVDGDGHQVFVLAPPVAIDAHRVTTPVSLTVGPAMGLGKAGAIQIELTIPPSWLADPTRAWPVSLDPTVVLNASGDKQIDSQNGNAPWFNFCEPINSGDCGGSDPYYPNYGLENVDEVGNSSGYHYPPAYGTATPAAPSTYRDLLRFDLSALPPHVTLLTARLQAVLDTRGDSGNPPVSQTQNASVYPLTRNWTSNATWQTSDGTTSWTTPGGDYDASGGVRTGIDFANSLTPDDLVPADNKYATWNITALARQWYLGTRSNNGVLVKMDDETVFSSHDLEWTNGLAIDYSYLPWQGGASPGGVRAFDPHAALKSDRALITFPQGDGQQLGVNVANGDMEIMRNDVSIPSLGLPNVIQRTFHSFAAAAGATSSIGHGWQLSVGGDTSLSPQPTGDAIYVDPTGDGFDIPSAITTAVPGVATDVSTRGAWRGPYGNDGYIMDSWNGVGQDLARLPNYVSSYSNARGTGTYWAGYSGCYSDPPADSRALLGFGDPNNSDFCGDPAAAAALSDPSQTQQVVTFNQRTLTTLSVYLLNWDNTSVTETVQVADAAGTHSYYASNYGNGLWVRFTNLVVGPTQPLTVTITGAPGSHALSSGLMFDNGSADGFSRAPGLAADLAQNADGTYGLTFNNGLTEHFSSAGQYISSSDRHGNTERFVYGGGTGGSCASNQIGSIIDTVGRTTTFSCSGSNITAITDADQRTVGYSTNGPLNDLAYVTDRAGGVTRYQYNGVNLPTMITDPIGNQTVITYDVAMRVSAIQDGAGSVTTFAYGATNTTTVTDRLNDQTVYTFDPATGEMLSVTDPNGNTTRYTYDANMLLLTTTDALGHVITNTVTSSTDEMASTDQLGIGSSQVYNALHEPISITDTQGQVTSAQYNAVGDPRATTDPLGYTTIITHAVNGETLASTNANRYTTAFGYDAFGDTIAVTDALGWVGTMAYDTNISRITSVTDAKHQTTTFGYDAEGRRTSVSYQNGKTARNYLDADGNITETVDTTGVTLFSYDGDNRLLQQTYPDGTVVRYTYDAAGRLKTKSEPGMPLTTYTYDPGGRLTRIDNSLWGPIIYTYDKASRLTSLGYPNGATTSYALADDNRLTGLTETVGASTILSDIFRFDKPGGGTWGPRSAEARNDNGTLSQWAYSYDADARLTGAALTTTIPSAPPNTSNRSTGYPNFTISQTSGSGGAYVYIVSDTSTGPQCQIGHVVTYYFDSTYEAQSSCYSGNFNANIQLPSRATIGLHTITVTVGDAYYGTLSSSARFYVTGSSISTYTYGYDGVGNMTNNNGIAQTYDADNQITASGSTTFGFDNNGNQTSTSASNAPRWTYDAANHTQSYNDQNAVDTFLTTGGGQRETKSVTTGGTTTTGTYDGDSIYQQTALTRKTVYYERAPSGRLLALTDGTTVYYYGLDGHGNVANLTDRSGNVVNAYLYDPYGNSLGKTETASIVNPWQYEGAFYEPESGIYLMGARYYAPQLGRFLQQDPLGGGYAYAGSDPCNNSDPTGLRTCYQYISPAQMQRAISNLQTRIDSDVAQENLGSSVGSTVGGLLGGVCGLLCIIIGGGAGGYAGGGIVQALINSLNAELKAWSPYAHTGLQLRYQTNVILGWDPGCKDGDSEVPYMFQGTPGGLSAPIQDGQNSEYTDLLFGQDPDIYG